MKLHIFECSSTLSFSELISILIKSKSENNFECSLLNIKYDDNSFLSTFYREVKRHEKTVDLNGDENIFTFNYYIYQNFSFHLIKSRIFLIIHEPNKYSKNLIEFLSSIFKLKLSFKTKKIDLNNFIKKASNLPQFQILKARFNEISLSKSSKASLEVTSSNNALIDFQNVFGNIYYDLARIKVTFFDESTYHLELSKNGLIFFSKHDDSSLKSTFKILNLLFFD
ncbi:hypothetical protein AWW72_14790 [Acinetobacter sp. NRRL B-65365]|uniref:hypothetical protein n=1 Tax=Acinetobacter sp. NRRL B-65365 TaxID=1785092 RepID=UPI0007A0B334|nr:hypothetical protein [Acinetobacter sp. NRRL B-65365]KYQ83291.1 hypothetical protein AWW72_14790 [Acinetobacter sp. NRRL B-65365]